MVNYIVGRWATKYKYLPTDIRFEGSCEERIQHLKARGYGLYSNIGQESSIVYWQENCQRLEAQYRLLQIQKEEQRLFDIQLEKDEEERLLQIQLENQRVQNEIKRKQIVPKIIPAVSPEIVATSSLIPLGIIAILLINSSRSKN